MAVYISTGSVAATGTRAEGSSPLALAAPVTTPTIAIANTNTNATTITAP
jgi:hypothetical protein